MCTVCTGHTHQAYLHPWVQPLEGDVPAAVDPDQAGEGWRGEGGQAAHYVDLGVGVSIAIYTGRLIKKGEMEIS